jgi:hypothetical protein
MPTQLKLRWSLPEIVSVAWKPLLGMLARPGTETARANPQ